MMNVEDRKDIRGRKIQPWARAHVAVLLLAVAVGFDRPRAHADHEEHAIKAAFIYNFVKFVEWPADAFDGEDAPFVIGIVGDDPFGSVIDAAMKEKNAKGRPFVVKRLKWGEEMKKCHILFVSVSEARKMGQLAELLKGANILTISETPDFTKQGGVISFFFEDNKVRFEINVDAAKRAKLKMSSKLLSLARIVKDSD